MGVFFSLLWINFLIFDIIEMKLEEKADSVFVSDLDDIVCSCWILWFKSVNFCNCIILFNFGIFRGTFKNLSN
jgi:hypothetical protein